MRRPTNVDACLNDTWLITLARSGCEEIVMVDFMRGEPTHSKRLLRLLISIALESLTAPWTMSFSVTIFVQDLMNHELTGSDRYFEYKLRFHGCSTFSVDPIDVIVTSTKPSNNRQTKIG